MMGSRHIQTIFFTGFFALCLSACSGGSQSNAFSPTPTTEIDYITPNSLSVTFANFYQPTNTSTTSVPDSMLLSSSLTPPSGLNMPTSTTYYGKSMLRFSTSGTFGLESNGINPWTSPLLLTEFSYLMEIRLLSGDGDILSYAALGGSENLVKLSIQSNKLYLSHITDATHYHTRIYDVSSLLNQNIVVGIVAGTSPADLELYINGFRRTDYTTVKTAPTDPASDLPAVLRNLNIGGLTSANFYLGQLIGFASKLNPKTMYQISKYVCQNWDISMNQNLTSEIRTGTSPMVEPPNLIYSFVAGLILTPKCAGCHSASGGQTPYLDTYANVMAGMGNGDKAVNTTTPLTSRIYVRTKAGSMPTSSPLSSTEVDYLRMWIEAGAPQ